MAFIILAFLLFASQAAHGYINDTELKKHVGFFDRDQDGIIHITETIEGFRALGLGTVEATSFAAAIHARLSSQTLPSVASSYGFPIVVDNIKLAKHTSDTGVFDHEGRFVPENFEAIFAKHAHKKSNALDSSEIDELLVANRKSNDKINSAAATAEWKLLYRLGKDADGFLPKENVKNVYDGYFFRQLATNISTSGTNA